MFITSRAAFDFKPLWAGNVQLQGNLSYADKLKNRIDVHDGFICDLASYKLFSKIIFDKLGHSMRPAVLHDFLYRTQPKGMTRADADRIYKEALILEGTSELSANIQWAGVRLGGWKAWNKYETSLAAARG